MKKLPIGVSNLREIIEDGYAYVDKTRTVHQLVESGKYYFLSRPRRFGKSLFIDTLKQAFEGNQNLFQGLWLHDHWDWEKKYPVIHISFGSDAQIRFAFLTGVSKFSKVSLFSGLNNLRDITLSPQYATICGYTEPEMTGVFSQYLEGKSLEKIRHWYNGYSWLGERVYNPFSILNYLEEDSFKNYWFESGTPEFLVKLFKKKRYFIPDIEHLNASESIIGAFDVDFVEPENLLFQTGYLTVEQEFRVAGKIFYKLRYPNMEVKSSLSDYILKRYTPDPALKDKTQLLIYDALKNIVRFDWEKVVQ